MRKRCPTCWRREPDQPTADNICLGLYVGSAHRWFLRLRNLLR